MTDDEHLALVRRVVEQIRPLLKGKPPPVQGMVVAELAAIFVACHVAEAREDVLALHVETVRDLIPTYAKRRGD